MTRRQALLALMAGTIGIIGGGGRVAFPTEQGDFTTPSKVTFNNFKPNRVVWHMDEIKTIELILKGEKIEIKTGDIFEALR